MIFIQKLNEKIIDEITDSFNDIDYANLASWLEAYKSIETKPFHLLGHFLKISWVNQNSAKMFLETNNSNRYGNAHGGALYTLADVVIAEDILHRFEDKRDVFTLELKMNYIRKANGNYVIGKSEILHLGSRTAVAECSIYNEDNELVAKAFGTFFIDFK
ncbi:uncharacterized protein (TIGR00369 family) [Peribacillus frigoritolerans]|uniref:PaaI family thioesterase n=1 Tax=Peribacillus frigoritolerans TaxID=450367 RepID=UPI0007BED190|nr:PaaI family thioesterase [Peribacillus frigoritolerans]TWE00590.1 uncharacterized protein (TIGR00369 family) [Peribacillus frigoritolerans]